MILFKLSWKSMMICFIIFNAINHIDMIKPFYHRDDIEERLTNSEIQDTIMRITSKDVHSEMNLPRDQSQAEERAQRDDEKKKAAGALVWKREEVDAGQR